MIAKSSVLHICRSVKKYDYYITVKLCFFSYFKKKINWLKQFLPLNNNNKNKNYFNQNFLQLTVLKSDQ